MLVTSPGTYGTNSYGLLTNGIPTEFMGQLRDELELDPRNPWMWGPLPGTIPHKFILFGTYRTPIGLNIGAMFYWDLGMVFTESYKRKDTYINWPLNAQWAELAKTGQERGPA